MWLLLLFVASAQRAVLCICCAGEGGIFCPKNTPAGRVSSPLLRCQTGICSPPPEKEKKEREEEKPFCKQLVGRKIRCQKQHNYIANTYTRTFSKDFFLLPPKILCHICGLYLPPRWGPHVKVFLKGFFVGSLDVDTSKAAVSSSCPRQRTSPEREPGWRRTSCRERLSLTVVICPRATATQRRALYTWLIV